MYAFLEAARKWHSLRNLWFWSCFLCSYTMQCVVIFEAVTFTCKPVNPTDSPNTKVSLLRKCQRLNDNLAMSESTKILFRGVCVYDGCLLNRLYFGGKRKQRTHQFGDQGNLALQNTLASSRDASWRMRKKYISLKLAKLVDFSWIPQFLSVKEVSRIFQKIYCYLYVGLMESSSLRSPGLRLPRERP